MRLLALSLAALLALGAVFYWLPRDPLGDASGDSDASATPVVLLNEEPSTSEAALDDPEPLVNLSLEPAREPTDDAIESDASVAEDVGFAGQTLVEFQGFAMVQPKGERPSSASRGTIEIALLAGGRLVPVTIPIQGGKFSVELPYRARIRVHGGRLDGQTVRFLGFESKGPFTLNEEQNYAFIGEPVPLNTLRVFEGTQGVALAGITVRRCEHASTALLEGSEPAGEILAQGEASPIELPSIPSDHPVWLHVSAEGYATTALLLDPSKAQSHDVVLWPAASLIVRVTGKDRGKLKALILHREEPASADGRKPTRRHFATLQPGLPGVTRDPDATIFTLENVPALSLRLEARGFDQRGRETLIGVANATLGPGERRTVELRVTSE